MDERVELTYAVVTPARNESDNLIRLAAAMRHQSVTPVRWVIIDHGSTDDTRKIAEDLQAEVPWIQLLVATGEPTPTRGGPIVEAFMLGLNELERAVGGPEALPDVVVKLDADTSFADDHFELLLTEFRSDPTLGIASSVCWEQVAGMWTAQRVARSHPRGAVRAYRRACLQAVLPLEPRMGWDTIDELKAQLGGWTVREIASIAFYHYRETGERDGGSQSWESQGALAWYLGYRMPYLVLRTIFRARHDRRALAMLRGWFRAWRQGDARYGDLAVRALLRDQQRLLQLGQRAGEVRRRSARR